ncbi:UNVERIFIED_CONTAM: hypothetical protein FKN15_038535 [Acipenser sinensis]
MNPIFAQCLSDGGVMNTDLSRGERGLQIPGCCSRFLCDFLDDFTPCSWRDFGRTATPGKIHYCPKLSPFGQYGSDCCLVEPQSLKNGFVTLSRLNSGVLYWTLQQIEFPNQPTKSLRFKEPLSINTVAFSCYGTKLINCNTFT